MTLLEHSQIIESFSFSLRYGVTNSVEVLRLAWATDDTMQAIIKELEENPAQSAFVLERLHVLAETEFESGTWHPQDIAVTAYLFSLEQSALTEVLSHAEKIALDTKGLYWARKMLEKIAHEKLPQKP